VQGVITVTRFAAKALTVQLCGVSFIIDDQNAHRPRHKLLTQRQMRPQLPRARPLGKTDGTRERALGDSDDLAITRAAARIAKLEREKADLQTRLQQLERGLIQRALSMPPEVIDLPPLPRSSAAPRGH
jgi:hypothetical protein